ASFTAAERDTPRKEENERDEEVVIENAVEVASSTAETPETAPSIATEHDASRKEKNEREIAPSTVETPETAPFTVAERDASRKEENEDVEAVAESVAEVATSTAETPETAPLTAAEHDASRKEENEEKKDVLRREDELLQKIIETHNAVKNAALNREWTDFEALAFSLETYKEQFDVLEKERLVLFGTASDAEGETPHFYTMVSHLPEDERKELSDLYRSVKDRALKLQIANEALLRYLNEARSTIGDFMKVAFPDRKSGVYSRQGKKVSSDMRSLILDKIL
ncbi:MAG: hypothetical protein LBH85_09115, partial [Treponema sp.]|nr:hypothetical protein [Treponema sp.]